MSDTTPTNEAQDTTSRKSGNPEAYAYALQLAFYEGQISWQMNVLFVGLNIGIGTIIQDRLSNLTTFEPITFFMAFIGLVINTLWLGTFMRNNRYYDFRMAQARNAEPNDYNLVKGRGYRFSKGREVEIPATEGNKRRRFQLSAFERFCSNKLAILVSICCFFGGFFTLFILSIISLI